MLMTLLHALGVLLLALLLLFAAVFVVLLLLPFRAELRRGIEGTPLRIRLSAGPLHITRRIGGAKKEKKKTTQKKPKKEKPPKAQKKQQAPWVDLQRLDIRQALDLALLLTDDLAGAVTFEKLHVTVILHTGDAGETGNLLGTLSAAVGMLYPVMERCFVLQDTKIALDADFEAEKTVWGIDLAVMTRLGRYPRIFWKRRRELWALWKSIRLSKEERQEYLHQKQTEERE